MRTRELIFVGIAITVAVILLSYFLDLSAEKAFAFDTVGIVVFVLWCLVRGRRT